MHEIMLFHMAYHQRHISWVRLLAELKNCFELSHSIVDRNALFIALKHHNNSILSQFKLEQGL